MNLNLLPQKISSDSQGNKKAVISLEGDEALEVGSSDPLLREIDAELEASLASDDVEPMTAEEAVEEVEETSDEE
mgnify:CR=1 FL=1